MKLILLLITVSCLIHPNVNFDELCEKTKDTVVEVIGTNKPKGWFGGEQATWNIQGFFLNKEGYVLTCKEFLENKEDFKIRRDECGYSVTEPAVVIAIHPVEDAAILKIDDYTGEANYPVNPILYEPMRTNTTVFVPFAEVTENERYPALGKVLKMTRANNQYTAMVAIRSMVGSNGLPIFNTEGSIIGMKAGSYNKKSFLFCCPMVRLKKWINETLDQETQAK
jgi:hypothetical protein